MYDEIDGFEKKDGQGSKEKATENEEKEVD